MNCPSCGAIDSVVYVENIRLSMRYLTIENGVLIIDPSYTLDWDSAEPARPAYYCEACRATWSDPVVDFGVTGVSVAS